MPIYEFHCEKCGHDFEELFRSASEDRRVSCPECRSHRCAKQWSAFGFSVRDGAAKSSCSHGGCENCRGGTCKKCSH